MLGDFREGYFEVLGRGLGRESIVDRGIVISKGRGMNVIEL